MTTETIDRLFRQYPQVMASFYEDAASAYERGCTPEKVIAILAQHGVTCHAVHELIEPRHNRHLLAFYEVRSEYSLSIRLWDLAALEFCEDVKAHSLALEIAQALLTSELRGWRGVRIENE